MALLVADVAGVGCHPRRWAPQCTAATYKTHDTTDPIARRPCGKPQDNSSWAGPLQTPLFCLPGQADSSWEESRERRTQRVRGAASSTAYHAAPPTHNTLHSCRRATGRQIHWDPLLPFSYTRVHSSNRPSTSLLPPFHTHTLPSLGWQAALMALSSGWDQLGYTTARA